MWKWKKQGGEGGGGEAGEPRGSDGSEGVPENLEQPGNEGGGEGLSTGPEIQERIGQLEAELEEDSWVVEPARSSDVFSIEPGRLWEEILRRKGSSFDLLRLMPLDPTQN